MTYTKPEINLLGNATQLIQLCAKCAQTNIEVVPPFCGDPAYDLDE